MHDFCGKFFENLVEEILIMGSLQKIGYINKILICTCLIFITKDLLCQVKYCSHKNSAKGSIETVDKIANVSIVSKSKNDYKAEFRAGVIQGQLQKTEIVSARDNTWDAFYLTDPRHTFPTSIPPSSEDFSKAKQILEQNLTYTLDYIKNCSDSKVRHNLRRLMYRLLGIYVGSTDKGICSMSFDDTWVPVFSEPELTLGYETPNLTFLDIYFINASLDLSYITFAGCPGEHEDRCSAFVKKTDKDIFLAHNTWASFLSQTMALTFYINGDYLSVNLSVPGTINSLTDFGYNNKGIIFNETTATYEFNIPKVNALWMFWRASLAEQFAGSLDEFFEYLSLEASGTYMNGFMIVDIKNREIGLVEMSYKSFVYFKPCKKINSNDLLLDTYNNHLLPAYGVIGTIGNHMISGKGASVNPKLSQLCSYTGYTVITKPEGLSQEYDPKMIQPDYIIGVNYPASLLIRDELKSVSKTPARKRQFVEHIKSVNTIETAKNLICFVDPDNPLSIAGRWDLGYGQTSAPKVKPSGTIDAKVVAATQIEYTSKLEGIFDLEAQTPIFLMKFGTPRVKNKPFVWSQSQWRGWKLRDVPDILDGQFVHLTTRIK